MYLNQQDSTAPPRFYSSDQCVPCGDAAIGYPKLTWQQICLLVTTDREFNAKFDLSKEVASGQLEGDWGETSIASGLVHKVTVESMFWFMPVGDFRKKFLCSPSDVGQPLASLEEQDGHLQGTLVRPELGDNPYLYRRVKIATESTLALQKIPLPHRMCVREEHASEFLGVRVAERVKQLGEDVSK